MALRADEGGNKDVLGMVDGFGESNERWRELFFDLKRPVLEMPPRLVVGPSRPHDLHAPAG